jgi:ArsR family transcriptional regulator, lead/cadmium/zinc/bismuth-responsive transcriptional repressor
MGKKDKKDPNRPKIRAKRRPAGADRFRDEPKEISVFDPENVERVLDSMPTPDRIARAADRLQGLAHPSRLQAVAALNASELCVGDVSAVLGLSLSATSTMLKQLRNLGFVSVRHAGKQTYYKIASPLPKAVMDVLFRLDEAPAPRA